jgi:dihydroneopterin triphosphate diphosphatase
MAGIRADIVQVHPYRVRDGRVEHLALRRSDDDELCPGAWQVITGGTHSGETAADAAVRELVEETSLEALRWQITGRVSTFYFAPFDAVVLSPIIGCEVDAAAEPTISDEHSEYRWLSAPDALALLAFASHREGVEVIEWLVARPIDTPAE